VDWIEYGTSEIVKARFRLWLSNKRPSNLALVPSFLGSDTLSDASEARGSMMGKRITIAPHDDLPSGKRLI